MAHCIGFNPASASTAASKDADLVDWIKSFYQEVVKLCKLELSWNYELLSEPRLVLKTLISESIAALQPPLHARATRWLEQDERDPSRAAGSLCQLHDAAASFNESIFETLSEGTAEIVPASLVKQTELAEKLVRAAIFRPFLKLQQTYLSYESKYLQECSDHSLPAANKNKTGVEGRKQSTNPSASDAVEGVTAQLETILARLPGGLAELCSAAVSSINRSERFCGGVSSDCYTGIDIFLIDCVHCVSWMST